MALFTGKGDGGTTKVIDSKERISKASPLPEALGTLDELNSFLGLARAATRRASDPAIPIAEASHLTSAIVRDVQETLFIVQAEVAGSDKRIREGKTKEVEAVVNAIEMLIPPLKGFSIAGGTELSAIFDVARTLARRAERRLAGLEQTGERELSAETRAYMNRLSSLLFALARHANHAAGVPEEVPSYS